MHLRELLGVRRHAQQRCDGLKEGQMAAVARADHGQVREALGRVLV